MSPRLSLFEGFGVEIEYAIVDAESLDVRPLADDLMAAVSGEPVSELERGPIAWSNELALHVLELKTNGPAADLGALPEAFGRELSAAEATLGGFGARLLPGGMHPWMDPAAEARLWPHEYNEVYRAFDRIFGCSGHGWTNLQSVHLNLPFADDGEFRTLHAAIRLLLPITPALAASSPVVDGRLAGALDARLIAYMGNSVRIPSVAGQIVPEPVRSRAEYERVILEKIYRDLEPHDPEGILRHDWANARGAIARFGRGSIEIRLLDSQECATADIAVVAAVADAARLIVEEVDPDVADAVPTEELADLLRRSAREAQDAVVSDGYRRALGLPCGGRAADMWSGLLDRAARHAAHPRLGPAVEHVLSSGSLARRLTAALGPDPDRARLRSVYARLCDCLREDALFE